MAQPTKKSDSLKQNDKTKPAAQQPEITPHTVVPELPLAKVIDNTLAKSNVTKKVLAAMKSKYMVPSDQPDILTLKPEFVLKDPNDKETYLRLKEERKGVRKIGIITEDLCKTGRAEAIQIQKLWLGKEKEILDEVAIVQNPLDVQIKIYEDEQERLRLEEEKRKDEQLIVRQAELIKMGAVNANGCMNINDLSIENSSIREADDETYNETILPLFKMHYEQNEKVRIENEKEQQRQDELRKEEQKKLDKEKEKLKEQQDNLQKERDQFKQQQEEMKQLKIKNRKMQLEAIGMIASIANGSYRFADINVSGDDIESMDEVQWENKIQEIKPAIEQKKNDMAAFERRKTERAAQLSSLGMTFTGSAYTFEDVNIPATDLTGMDNKTWDELIATTTPIIEDRKDKHAKLVTGRNRLEILKSIGLVKDDTEKSLGELSNDEWATLTENYKKEVEAARQQEKIQQQKDEQEKASDKENWATFLNSLNEFVISSMPTFKNKTYQGKATAAKQKFEEISEL